MKIAIYGRQFNDTVLPYVQQVFNQLAQHEVEIYLFKDIDVFLTLGGDGTLLDIVSFIRDSGIPVMGINFGRLGFLAGVNKNDIAAAIHAVVNRKYTLDE